MMLKRIISLFIIILIIVPTIISCSKDDSEDTNVDGQTVATDSGTDDDMYNITDDIGTRDYGGRVVTVGTSINAGNLIILESMDGNIVNDSLYKRNKTVESRLNVVLESFPAPTGGNWGLVAHIETTILSGSIGFDFMYHDTWLTSAIVGRGWVHDLSMIDEIDLEKPYWTKYVNDAMSVGKAYPMITGAAALEFYRAAWAIGVNKTLLNSQSGAPDLFEVVNEGKWTLEYLRVLSSGYYADRGTDGTDEEDILGFVTANKVHTDPFLTGSAVNFLHRDGNGFLYCDFDAQRASDAADETVRLFSLGSTYVYETGAEVHRDVTNKFANGEALAMTAELRSFEEQCMVEMSDEYLILPTPKLSESQVEYGTHLHDGYYIYAVPISTAYEDLSLVGAVLEVLASEAYRQVMPNYYEKILKVRIAKSPENAEMIEKIVTNVSINPAVPYAGAASFTSTGKGDSLQKVWREVIGDGYTYGSGNANLSSAIPDDVEDQVNTKLNAADGLNTIFKY